MISMSMLILSSHTRSMFVPNFKILLAVVPVKPLTKMLLEKKKNGQTNGMISMSTPILSHTMQVVVSDDCALFQNPRCISS